MGINIQHPHEQLKSVMEKQFAEKKDKSVAFQDVITALEMGYVSSFITICSED